MEAQQVYQLIEMNKTAELQVCTSDDAKLCEIICANWQDTTDKLRELIPSITSYKRVVIRGRVKNGALDSEGNNKKGTAPWTSGFRWHLDLVPAADKVQPQQNMGNPGGGVIGAMDYITQMTGMLTNQFELQRKNMELQMKIDNQSPEKWIPVFTALAPALGLSIPRDPQQQGIAGKQLEYGDINTQSKTELDARMCAAADSLNRKIKLSQMCELLEALDRNPQLTTDVTKIIKLLNVIVDKPQLLNSAMSFI